MHVNETGVYFAGFDLSPLLHTLACFHLDGIHPVSIEV